MIFPLGYDEHIGADNAKWLKERNVKYKIRWSFHDDNYLLMISNEDDAVAFKLVSGMKSGSTGFVYDDQK